MKKIIAIGLSALILVLSGCANKDALEEQLAFELGKDKRSIKVSNIDVGFYETRFNAHINGRLHNCTALGGNFMSAGKALNPRCVPVGGKGKATVNSCNTMLEAAGRCKR